MLAKQYLNKIVTVKMDRPLGTKHPKHGWVYETNYGFIPNTVSGDGEELDAYVLGVTEPLDEFTGRCIAIIHRTDDNDDKLIVVPDGLDLDDETIGSETAYQEKWFKHVIIRGGAYIFLAGGGGYEDSAELDKYFFDCIPESGKILYCPAAMDSDKYQGAQEWFTGLVRRYTKTASIELLIEDNANSVNLNDYDAVFIGGGNTYKLLDFVVKSGLDAKLKDYIQNGGVIYGGSAGAAIMGKSIDTVRWADDPTGYNHTDGLDLLNGASVTCHWPQGVDYIHDFAVQHKCTVYCLPENCGMIFSPDGELLMTVGSSTEIL